MPMSSGQILPQPLTRSRGSRATAVVYCEANFGRIDGKTANGLVRHSERYEIVAVIDSQRPEADAGMALDGVANGVPIRRDLDDSLAHVATLPDFLIFGIAPASGTLSTAERGLLLDAMSRGMSIVNGLHEFLNDDPEFAAARAINDVQIIDVRRPRPAASLRTFTGRIHEVTCPRIAVMGTDCAIGKRTTATVLTRALNDRGIHAVMVGTGQTGLIQGARYGIALDAVPPSSARASWKQWSLRPSSPSTPTSSSWRARARSAIPRTRVRRSSCAAVARRGSCSSMPPPGPHAATSRPSPCRHPPARSP